MWSRRHTDPLSGEDRCAGLHVPLLSVLLRRWRSWPPWEACLKQIQTESQHTSLGAHSAPEPGLRCAAELPSPARPTPLTQLGQLLIKLGISPLLWQKWTPGISRINPLIHNKDPPWGQVCDLITHVSALERKCGRLQPGRVCLRGQCVYGERRGGQIERYTTTVGILSCSACDVLLAMSDLHNENRPWLEWLNWQGLVRILIYTQWSTAVHFKHTKAHILLSMSISLSLDA